MEEIWSTVFGSDPQPQTIYVYLPVQTNQIPQFAVPYTMLFAGNTNTGETMVSPLKRYKWSGWNFPYATLSAVHSKLFGFANSNGGRIVVTEGTWGASNNFSVNLLSTNDSLRRCRKIQNYIYPEDWVGFPEPSPSQTLFPTFSNSISDLGVNLIENGNQLGSESNPTLVNCELAAFTELIVFI